MDSGRLRRYSIRMIAIAALILGAGIGWFRATRMGGAWPDKLQYAAAHAMAFAVLSLLLIVFLTRMG